MTAVLSAPLSALTPEAAGTRGAPRAEGSPGGFEALLMAGPDLADGVEGAEDPLEPMVEDLLHFYPVEATPQPTPQRAQGPQFLPEPETWPTAAVPLSPPGDGQGLASSAPGAPHGPQQLSQREEMDGLLGTEHAPLPAEDAPTDHDADLGPTLRPARAVRELVDAGAKAGAPAPLPDPSADVVAGPDPAEPRPAPAQRIRATPPPPPAPADVPEPAWATQVDPGDLGTFRVEVDAELAIEVRAAHKGLDVTLDGTPLALSPMEGVQSEIDAALQDAGSQLRRYAQRHRDPNGPRRGPDDDSDGGTPVGVDDPQGPQSLGLSGASLIHVVV